MLLVRLFVLKGKTRPNLPQNLKRKHSKPYSSIQRK